MNALPRLTIRSVIIGRTLSCIPMNQPFTAMRVNVAGAAQILTWKYPSASSLTSGEHFTTRKARSTKTHWANMQAAAMIRAMPEDLNNASAAAFMSPLP